MVEPRTRPEFGCFTRTCWLNPSRDLVAPSIVGSEFNSDRGNGDLNSDGSWTLHKAWSPIAWSKDSLILIVAFPSWTPTHIYCTMGNWYQEMLFNGASSDTICLAFNPNIVNATMTHVIATKATADFFTHPSYSTQQHASACVTSACCTTKQRDHTLELCISMCPCKRAWEAYVQSRRDGAHPWSHNQIHCIDIVSRVRSHTRVFSCVTQQSPVSKQHNHTHAHCTDVASDSRVSRNAAPDPCWTMHCNHIDILCNNIVFSTQAYTFPMYTHACAFKSPLHPKVCTSSKERQFL